MSDVQCLIDAGNHLGESPIWSATEQALWWVNCEQPPELHRWDAATGMHRIWPMPQRIGGFVHKASGGLLVVLADGSSPGVDTPEQAGDGENILTSHSPHP